MQTNRQEITRLAGFVGGAMALAGYVRHSILDLWGWFNISLVVVGLVLLAASIVLNFGSIVGFFRGRSGRLGANVALLTIAVVGLIAIANFLGYRHHKRFDLTTEGLYTLSEQTKKVLQNLPKDVKVIKFAQENDQQLADQMAEFRYETKRLTYERIDPQQRPEVARQYGIKSMGETVVAAGDRIEHPTATDEQSLINAILKVTRDTLKTVCFTEGHEEKSLSEGYSQADAKLKGENYQTKTINLAREKQVPAECAVLVVAGPKTSILPPEATMIGQYLDGGGKAMLLLDPDTDPQLDDVLKRWSVVLGKDNVLDVSAAGQMFGGGPLAPLVFNYGSHPITKNFTRSSMTIFPEARSVKVAEGSSGGVNATTLLTTSEASWAETDLKPGVEPRYDEGKDTKGPVSLGVAASKNMGENKEGRLVVIGDSDFASNQAFRFQRNGDLFMNSINWLAQDEDLISIRPKAATNRSVTMSEAQQRTFFWMVVLLMPLAVIGAGGYIWWKRR